MIELVQMIIIIIEYVTISSEPAPSDYSDALANTSLTKFHIDILLDSLYSLLADGSLKKGKCHNIYFSFKIINLSPNVFHPKNAANQHSGRDMRYAWDNLS